MVHRFTQVIITLLLFILVSFLVFPDEEIIIEDSQEGEAFIIIDEESSDQGEQSKETEDAEKPVDDSEQEKKHQRITITAEIEVPDLRSIPGQMSVITADQIEASPSKSLSEIIEPVLGVSLTRYGGVGSSAFVSIRGSSAEQVLVLINGKKINTAQGGGVDLSMLNPDMIERIEVYRGGNSAVYGENAIGGVINVITKSAGKDNFEGTLTGGYGSFQTIYGSASASFSGNENLWGMAVSGYTLRSTGDYSFEDEHFGTLERENADIVRAGGSVNAHFTPASNFEIGTDSTFVIDEKGVPGTVEFPTNSARMRDERETIGIEGSWRSNLGELTGDISLMRQEREYSDPDFDLGPVDDRHENLAGEAELRYSDEVHNGRWAAAWLGGYSYRLDSLDSTALTGSGGVDYSSENIQRLRHSVFSRGELRLFPHEESGASRLTVFPALRWDSWQIDEFDGGPSSSGMQPSWKMGLLSAVTADETVVLKASGGSTYRTPSFDDLFWPSTSFAEGNPELEPEESRFLDGGCVLYPFPSLQIEGAFFLRKVRNLIQWNPGPNGKWRPINIGQTRFWGVETELRSFFDFPFLSSYAETTLNGTYLNSEDLTDGSATYGKVIPRKPVWKVNGTFSLNHDAGHSLRMEIRYVGTRYITAANTKWFDPYMVTDIAATVAVDQNLEFFISANNIFNIAYIDLREYPVPGIEFSAEMRYAF